MKLNKQLKFLTIIFFTNLFLFTHPLVKNSFAVACVDDANNSITCDGQLTINSSGETITNSGTINASSSVADIRGINGVVSYATIINSGTINTTTTSWNARGIGISGDYATITNSSTGIINSTASAAGGSKGARGIGVAGDYATITNSGTINSTALGSTGFAYGIGVSGNNTLITNTGIINASAEEGDVRTIVSSNTNNPQPANATIINSGTINATASAAYNARGISASGNYATITNSGIINSTAVGGIARGIGTSGTNTVITNSGTINAAASTGGARGIGSSGDNTTITNSGIINATALVDGGMYGIRVDAIDNIITNSGKIIAETAIDTSSSTTNTLNIQPGSYIGGAFNLANDTTVNVITGPSHSILYYLDNPSIAPNFSGPIPGFFNSSTYEVATYDPSGFKGIMNELGDLTNNLSRVGLNNLSNFKDKQFQLAAFGGKLKHDGDNSITLAQQINQGGVSGSYNYKTQDNVNLNLMAGYVSSNISVDSRFARSYDIDSEGLFAGLFGSYNTDLALVNFGLTAGKLKHKNDRFVNDNTIADGASHSTSSYDSTFIAPQIGISKNFNVDNIIYKPSASVRYNIQSVDGYTETGSNGNAVVKSYTTGVLESNIEIAATKLFNTNSYTIKTGYLNRQSMGDNNTSVTMIGQTQSIGFGDKNSSNYYVGFGADVDLLKTFKLSFDGEKYIGDANGFQGMVKLTTAF
jgi:hypothetical protein